MISAKFRTVVTAGRGNGEDMGWSVLRSSKVLNMF